MKCLVCRQEQLGPSAFSLLGYSVCHACENLIVSLQPYEAEYLAVVKALSAPWAEYLGDRTLSELVQDSSSAGD